MKYEVKIDGYVRFQFDTAEEALQFALTAKKAYIRRDDEEVEVVVVIGIGEVSA